MAWITLQELKMLERWAGAREFHLIKGKDTFGKTDKIILEDLMDSNIRSGEGLLNIGEGPLKFPFNYLNKKIINNILYAISILPNNEGILEIAAVGGRKFIKQLDVIMTKELKLTAKFYLNSSTRQEGVSQNMYYELDGVRIIPVWSKLYDDKIRHSEYSVDGNLKSSWNGFFTSLGNTEDGNPNIELFILGNHMTGTVEDVNSKIDKIQTSVVGKHTCFLTETGIITRDQNGIAELYHV